MNKFLNELIKVALRLIAVVGMGLIAVGIVLLICPEILRWGIVLISILGGIYLCGCALYGIINAKKQITFR